MLFEVFLLVPNVFSRYITIKINEIEILGCSLTTKYFSSVPSKKINNIPTC